MAVTAAYSSATTRVAIFSGGDQRHLHLAVAEEGGDGLKPHAAVDGLGGQGMPQPGKLAERFSTDMDRAFTMLRDYARTSNQHLTDVARDFVTGGTADFPPPARRQPGR